MAPDLVPHKHNMAKTRLAVIQDDILAAKHALANNLSFEGLEGDQLSSVLQTLLAQRAQEAATIPATATAVCSMAKGSPSPSSSSPCSSGGSGSGGGVSSSNAVSRIPVNGKSAPKKGKKRPSSSTAPPASKSSKRPQTTPVNASPPSSSSSVAKTPAAAKTPAPAKTPKTEQQRRRQSSSGKAAKKARSPGPHDRMRQLRKSIKIGDTVSVLMDVNIDGIWEKEWVEGEVIREVRRKDGYSAQRVSTISTPGERIKTVLPGCEPHHRR